MFDSSITQHRLVSELVVVDPAKDWSPDACACEYELIAAPAAALPAGRRHPLSLPSGPLAASWQVREA